MNQDVDVKMTNYSSQWTLFTINQSMQLIFEKVHERGRFCILRQNKDMHREPSLSIQTLKILKYIIQIHLF